MSLDQWAEKVRSLVESSHGSAGLRLLGKLDDRFGEQAYRAGIEPIDYYDEIFLPEWEAEGDEPEEAA